MNYDLTPLREKEAELIRAQRIADQAQKLEAIGHLTGGIAHDFNNLLAVIHGNLELLLDDKDWSSASEAERLDIITSALSAARRGGELTKNMLAFARKSTLQPKTLDINEVVKETERWLSRTIPSNIQIETNLQSRTWPVRLDLASLQSAIVNTVVNARDAMPKGGKLTIETSNLRVNQEHVQDIEENIPPGRYTMLAITDTGTGIDGADLSKIFDPFFSTQQVGAGTGLGLSMVQGFVKQSNGFVRAYSEVGVGTSIKLYFPAIEGDSGARPILESDVPVAYSEGTSARLLVVDDKVEILAVLRRVLKSAGYAVDTAVDGDAAFELFQSNGPYDLLITDIVMPSKLQGPGLAKALREIQPDLPAIFMSGYASEATVHGNGLKVDDIRLMKPVPHIEMLESVRKCLESR
jgi:nitrogen-specific signal transduction histidine kinase